MPDVDLVVAAVDEPRIKTFVYPRYWCRTRNASERMHERAAAWLRQHP